MLRSIKSDIAGKRYAEKARRLTKINDALTDEIRRAVASVNKKAASAIRSVTQTGSTAIVRAASRPAMSELYTVREIVMRAVKGAGIKDVRFMV